jgi:Tol biopolymer transport system component
MLVVGLTAIVATQRSMPPISADAQFQAALQKELVDGDLNGAIESYRSVMAHPRVSRNLAAQALVRMAGVYEKLGDDSKAKTLYQQIVRDYSDQPEAMGAARAKLSQAPNASSRAPRLLWSGDGPNSVRARPSPDGRSIVFSDAATGNVAIRDLRTSVTKLLTNTGGWASGLYSDSAVISPDGQQVAYFMYIDSNGQNSGELRVQNVAEGDRAKPHVVFRTTQDATPYKFVWTPDGKSLVMLRSQPDSTVQIGTVTLETGLYRNIKSLEWRKPNLLSVSPDGRYVAYDVPAGEKRSPRDIFVLALNGSGEVRAVHNPEDDRFPLWSSDGSQLVFLTDHYGTSALCTMPMKDGRPAGDQTVRTPGVGSIELLGMTRDGSLFYREPPRNARTIYAADLEGVKVTQPPVAATDRIAARNEGPTWSTDGTYLAYLSTPDASTPSQNSVPRDGVLVVRRTSTGEERTIPLPTRLVTQFSLGPRWFPDNRSLLVERVDADGNGAGFYRLDFDGNTALVAHLSGAVDSYDLSSDGKTIFYARNDQLIRLDLDGRRETELPIAAHTADPFGGSLEIEAIAVSPDGDDVAVTLIGGHVEVVPAKGGPSRHVFAPDSSTVSTGSLRQALSWTPDKRFLLFVQDGPLLKVSSLGGAAEEVGLNVGNMKGLSVHPDGRRLVYAATSNGSPAKVWALDGFAPPVRAAGGR